MMKPPPDLNPYYLNEVLAKSAEKSQDPTHPDTLADHTWAVLSRLADQYRLRASLGDILHEPRLWHRLYWGCFFHDFGKAASGFQQRLTQGKVKNDWSEGRHRHEVLSLAFIDAAFPQGHPDRLPIIGVVATHHKDFANSSRPENSIAWKYNHGHAEQVEFLLTQLDDDLVQRLWRWHHEFGLRWARALGFAENHVFPVESVSSSITTQHILRCLKDFTAYYLEREDGDVEADALAHDIHYRGLILTADHAASAGTPPFPELPLNKEIAQKPLAQKQRTANAHQASAAGANIGSHILVAPTGSGKTEAALLWAAQQMSHRPAPRLFYTLPYQASMNAMADRLQRDFFGEDEEIVALQHSRATLKYYRDMMESDSGAENPHTATQTARAIKDRARLNYFPVQIFSPYQMLKAAFRLKGYEPLLVDYTNALFIFDEIHAYDAHRLALITTTMEWLAKHYHARFLVMTATLPPILTDALRSALALSDQHIITADDATFIKSQRHQVFLESGDLLEQLDPIHAQWQQGESILICCNTVSRAQQAYIALKKRFEANGQTPDDHLLLLHSRFNGKDRTTKERLLAQYVGVDTPREQRKPIIMVATQVVEVSLNIDFDRLYSDPAPLEALLQRFGRVNRGRSQRELRPVHVFEQPLGEKESLPYDHRIVERSLAVLRLYCADSPIDEKRVTQMLAEIYQGEIQAEWQKQYQSKCAEMRQTLHSLIPYQSASVNLEKSFYELFDGIDVLPKDSYDAWEKARDTGGYLAASQHLINISWKQLGILKSKGLVYAQEEDQFFFQINVHYDSEFGLDLNGQLGADNNA